MIVSVLRKPVRERVRTKERTPIQGIINTMININGETLHTSDQKISTCLETEPADDEGCQRSKVLHSGRWKEIRSEKNLEEITNLLIDDA